jgi:hypothetical protein
MTPMTLTLNWIEDQSPRLTTAALRTQVRNLVIRDAAPHDDLDINRIQIMIIKSENMQHD